MRTFNYRYHANDTVLRLTKSKIYLIFIISSSMLNRIIIIIIDKFESR